MNYSTDIMRKAASGFPSENISNVRKEIVQGVSIAVDVVQISEFILLHLHYRM